MEIYSFGIISKKLKLTLTAVISTGFDQIRFARGKFITQTKYVQAFFTYLINKFKDFLTVI